MVGEQVSRITISDLGVKPLKPIIQFMEPRSFDEIPRAIQALRERKTVILNLTMMEPDQAQRAVDFAAGGTFYGDGHQERVGESIFLFSPTNFEVVSSEAAHDGSQFLIKGDTVGDFDSNELSLTPFQESCLRIVRERWEGGQLLTTPTQLCEQINPSTESDAPFRLARRTLFVLNKLGLIEKLVADDACFDYRPVIKSDPASTDQESSGDE